MSVSRKHPRLIGVVAADELRARDLERRLEHLDPTASARGGSWRVELSASDDRLHEVVASLHDWLQDHELRAAIVTIDGAAYAAVADVGGPFGPWADPPRAREARPTQAHRTARKKAPA